MCIDEHDHDPSQAKEEASVPYQPKIPGLSFPISSIYPVGSLKNPEKSPACSRGWGWGLLSVPSNTGLRHEATSISLEQGTMCNGVQST